MPGKWRDQFSLIPNQSKYHELVREIFCTSTFFSNLSCYQEVPVVDLAPSYPNRTHRFDWYIEELCTVLELHGQHHYETISYGFSSFEEAQRDLSMRQARDSMKRQAVVENGYRYVALSYRQLKGITDEKLRSFLL